MPYFLFSIVFFPGHGYAISWSSSFFLHGFLLHMQVVDNVNTIIAPTLVGEVGSIYSY